MGGGDKKMNGGVGTVVPSGGGAGDGGGTEEGHAVRAHSLIRDAGAWTFLL